MSHKIEEKRLREIFEDFSEINCCYDNGDFHVSDIDGFASAILGEPTILKGRIAQGFYRALEILGGKSDVLVIAGSYGDTMDDDWVADALEEWCAQEIDQ